jgi:hypothetical protein
MTPEAVDSSCGRVTVSEADSLRSMGLPRTSLRVLTAWRRALLGMVPQWVQPPPTSM